MGLIFSIHALFLNLESQFNLRLQRRRSFHVLQNTEPAFKFHTKVQLYHHTSWKIYGFRRVTLKISSVHCTFLANGKGEVKLPSESHLIKNQFDQ